ncbi:Hypothetical protein PHPALM_15729 [Globisporangium polare]
MRRALQHVSRRPPLALRNGHALSAFSPLSRWRLAANDDAIAFRQRQLSCWEVGERQRFSTAQQHDQSKKGNAAPSTSLS